jgi:hypothetical protein
MTAVTADETMFIAAPDGTVEMAPCVETAPLRTGARSVPDPAAVPKTKAVADAPPTSGKMFMPVKVFDPNVQNAAQFDVAEILKVVLPEVAALQAYTMAVAKTVAEVMNPHTPMAPRFVVAVPMKKARGVPSPVAIALPPLFVVMVNVGLATEMPVVMTVPVPIT